MDGDLAEEGFGESIPGMVLSGVRTAPSRDALGVGACCFRCSGFGWLFLKPHWVSNAALTLGTVSGGRIFDRVWFVIFSILAILKPFRANTEILIFSFAASSTTVLDRIITDERKRVNSWNYVDLYYQI